MLVDWALEVLERTRSATNVSWVATDQDAKEPKVQSSQANAPHEVRTTYFAIARNEVRSTKGSNSQIPP